MVEEISLLGLGLPVPTNPHLVVAFGVVAKSSCGSPLFAPELETGRPEMAGSSNPYGLPPSVSTPKILVCLGLVPKFVQALELLTGKEAVKAVGSPSVKNMMTFRAPGAAVLT